MRGRGSTSGAPLNEKRAILLEITAVGGSLKITAVDEKDGAEISFVAPLNTSRADIERLAKAKLGYIRAKKNGER